ncbi:hypothetical protein D3C74_461470 [compost metagenome]
MRAETSMLVKQHMEYLSNPDNAAESRNFETIYHHMYYYFTSVLGMLPDDARSVVDDFWVDLMAQPDYD